MSLHGDDQFSFKNAFKPQGTLEQNQFGGLTGAQPNANLTGAIDNSFLLPNVDSFGVTDLNLPVFGGDNQIGGNAFEAAKQPGAFDFLSGKAFGEGGFAVPAAQAVSGLVGAYTGLQQLKQGRDIFDFQKGLTNRNLANQAQTINTQLEDQYSGRFSAGTPGAAKIEDYLARNRVSGTPI